MFARREEVTQRAERPVPPLAIEPAPVVSPPPAPAKPAAAAPRSAPPGTVVAALAQAKEEAPVEKPAVVPAKPAPPRPIQLPAAIALRFALTDPLTPFFNQERYFSRWNGVRLVNAESPPAPVAIQEKIPSSTNPATSGPRPATRPRWATRKDLPSSPVPKGIK
jgi:hypothetical protein